MSRFLSSFCLVLVLVAGLVAPMMAAESPSENGVLVEDRVLDLPQDANKWYVSVIGDAQDGRYRQVLGWFDSNASLLKLKRQVHFCPVRSNTAAFQERFASNVKGLPTVRMQTAEGIVVHESYGETIPMTPDGLYAAMADDAVKAERCVILPWRRNHVHPQPCPSPAPAPAPTPITPAPKPLDPGPDGKPIFDRSPIAQAFLPPWWAMLVSLGAGIVMGVMLGWKDASNKEE